MADREHLEFLKQGVAVWNQWRGEHPEIRPNLRGADLRRADLRRADLSFADLSEAVLWNADLSEADLSFADLSRAHLSGAVLTNANFSGANLRGAPLSKVRFSGANLSKVCFSEAHLNGADLSFANLSEADLSFANLFRADLRGAYLRGAKLNETKLNEANLSKANLSVANLAEARLSFVNFRGADLSFANLMGADLGSADLRGATFNQNHIGGTHFADIDLRQVKGLETLQHRGPSHISISTIYRSQGDIPEAFLRKAGVPDSLIEYTRSLVVKPIDYYTCFISYSSQDQAFADRLYADLQSKGVRCWFAPEDMKIGDNILVRIDESIRLYDKLLLVFSEHALKSSWVEREVATVLEKEQQQDQRVLFPIRLDESVMQTAHAWAADIRRRKHIGDFTRWKRHDDYQQAFERLLRDLKAEE
jgi:uncharacterized protein YjbI with pentapeptide repeats